MNDYEVFSALAYFYFSAHFRCKSRLLLDFLYFYIQTCFFYFVIFCIYKIIHQLLPMLYGLNTKLFNIFEIEKILYLRWDIFRISLELTLDRKLFRSDISIQIRPTLHLKTIQIIIYLKVYSIYEISSQRIKDSTCVQTRMERNIVL